MKSKIKGFEKLTEQEQATFIKVLDKHHSTMDEEERREWKPTSVKRTEGYLRVEFINGKWLHYTQKGEWY